jgi:hypothetical protein
VAFNQNYLQPNFAVRLTPTSWLGLDGNTAFVPGSTSNVVNVSFNPTGLFYGNYAATLLVQTTDTNQPLVALPVSLAITPIATWRQTYFGTAQNSGNAANTADPENDGIINIIAYAFGLNPLVQNSNPPPTDISYLAEVCTDLASGVWNSGPGYTSQTVTDNGDGTETVTVTDLAPINSTPAHFLRIRIVPQ